MNITNSMNFTNTKPVEPPKKEKSSSFRGKADGPQESDRRSASGSKSNRGDGRQYSARSFSVEGSPLMPNPSVTSFSGVHQPAYRKPGNAPNRGEEGKEQPKGFSANRAESSPGKSQSGEERELHRQSFERQPIYGHFMPGMHPMHPQMMMDPFGGFVQYAVPPGRAMPAHIPQAVPQAQKPTVVIQDDSGNAMNLSTWKEQKSEGDESQDGNAGVDEPMITEVPLDEASVSSLEVRTVASLSESEPPTPLTPAVPTSEKEEEEEIITKPDQLTYSLMLSYRIGKVDLNLISKDVLAARSEIEERNAEENSGKDANQLKYFQAEVETRQSLFGSNVTQAFKPRQQFSNQAENPFTVTSSESLDHVAKIKKALQGALNKITTSNYDQLSEKVMDMDFPQLCSDSQVMKDVIAMFFDKAINEPAWASVYASLFRDIRKRYEEDASKIDFVKTFRRELLAHCQVRFETGRRLQEEIALLPEDQQERSLPILRKQTFNNMKFIGELYKVKLITKKIMHNVICSTIFDQDQHKLTDEALEMCCELLTSIGGSLEEPGSVESKPYMDHYFESFARLAKVYPTPRVRFKIQNLIDLRASNWDTSRPVPETPLELKGRAKQFLANDRHRGGPQPPLQAAVKKVMNRQSASGQRAKASGRSSESPQPATPTTPMTPVTAQRISDRKKWREVMPEFIKEQIETIVETLLTYTANSRRAFLEEMFNYLLGVRFHAERTALHELMPALLKGEVFAKRDIDATCSRCVREWVENEAVMDQPKLWESWMDILCACLKTETVTSADCLEQALSDLIEKEDPENIAVFIAHVNKKLREHKQTGVLLRTLDLLKRPQQMEEVLQSDKATAEGFDTALAEFQGLGSANLGNLPDSAHPIDIQRRLYVLTTYLALNMQKESMSSVVLPLYSNVRSLFQEANDAECSIMQEVRMIRRLDISQADKDAVWEFLEKNQIINA